MQGIPSEQITSIQFLNAGDHIKYHKIGMLYAHHAIVCNVDYITGYYTIIHFDGDFGKTGINVAIRTERKQFVPGEFHVLVYSNRLPRETTIAVANYFLHEGFGDYHLVRNNCEHFASICACGKAMSCQELRFVALNPLMSLPTTRKIVIVQLMGYSVKLDYEDIVYN